MTDFYPLIPVLANHRVEFIIVGGGSYDDLLPFTVPLQVFGVD